MKEIFVIGGGASGLMAAYASAKNGNKVTILEKNEKLGKKIYITGKGRCNVTNDCDVPEFLQNVINGEKFLTGALWNFPPSKTMELLEQGGTALKVERGNRVFPISDHASDITKALEKLCKDAGVKIHCNEKVISIICQENKIQEIVTDKAKYFVDACIVCTGGISYPSTGSTGDGYTFAKELGLNIIAPKPALCGINLKGNSFKDLQGVSLKNVSLRCTCGEKILYNGFGEMEFTHYGISGPIVLKLSSLITRKDFSSLKLYLDLKPALDEQTLDKRILRDFETYKNKNVLNGLVDLLPRRMIESVVLQSGISAKKQVNAITKEERNKLINTLKNYTLAPLSLRGFEECIITSGGVDLKEINPRTMESKKIKGLYFSGEVLNCDAFTGGFNLQIAFATGWTAGNSIE